MLSIAASRPGTSFISWIGISVPFCVARVMIVGLAAYSLIL